MILLLLYCGLFKKTCRLVRTPEIGPLFMNIIALALGAK